MLVLWRAQNASPAQERRGRVRTAVLAASVCRVWAVDPREDPKARQAGSPGTLRSRCPQRCEECDPRASPQPAGDDVRGVVHREHELGERHDPEEASAEDHDKSPQPTPAHDHQKRAHERGRSGRMTARKAQQRDRLRRRSDAGPRTTDDVLEEWVRSKHDGHGEKEQCRVTPSRLQKKDAQRG